MKYSAMQFAETIENVVLMQTFFVTAVTSLWNLTRDLAQAKSLFLLLITSLAMLSLPYGGF